VRERESEELRVKEGNQESVKCETEPDSEGL